MSLVHNNISLFRKWAISLRLFSLPFAILPFVYGVLLASLVSQHTVDPWLTLFSLLTVSLFSMGANLLSDIMDYEKGIDQWPHSVSGGVIRKWITVKEAKSATVVVYLLGIFTGIRVMAMTGFWILPIGLIGFVISIMYAAGNRFACKYNITGEYCVMFAYGMVIPFASFAVTAGEYAFWPLLWSFPMGFILAAVKHANNWLESNLDDHKQPGITAVKLGNRGSRRYYIALLLLPYLVYIMMMIPTSLIKTGALLPASFYIVFLSLPYTIFLIKRAMAPADVLRPDRSSQLDTLTGYLFILFSTLSCVAVALV